MEEIIPNLNFSPLSMKMDTPDVVNGEIILQEFINFNQQTKRKRKESTELLINFIRNNEELIMKRIQKKNPMLNVEQVIEIAIGWDLDNVDSLINLANKKKFKEFTHLLLSY